MVPVVIRRRLAVLFATLLLWALAIQSRLLFLLYSYSATTPDGRLGVEARVALLVAILVIGGIISVIRRTSLFVYGCVELIGGLSTAWYVSGTLRPGQGLVIWLALGGSIFLINRGLTDCVDYFVARKPQEAGIALSVHKQQP